MKKNPLLQNQEQSATKRVVIGAVAVFFLSFFLLMQGRFTSMKHHMELYYAMRALDTGSQTTLQTAVPFPWDRLYTFPTGTSKEEMVAVMGLDSEKNLAVTGGAELQYYFVHQNELVCAAIGTAETLGFAFDWGGDVLDSAEETMFLVEDVGYVFLVVE